MSSARIKRGKDGSLALEADIAEMIRVWMEKQMAESANPALWVSGIRKIHEMHELGDIKALIRVKPADKIKAFTEMFKER